MVLSETKLGETDMILSGDAIREQHENGNIKIDPWDDSNLNPNSYNLHLHGELVRYGDFWCDGYHNPEWKPDPPIAASTVDYTLDMKKENRTFPPETIPEEGFVLQPGELYLARTVEYTETHGLVPMLEGRSSIGRLGMYIHVTAGFGDVGFCGYWTLEISVVRPLRIYGGVPVAQIFYHTVEGPIREYQSGKYQNNRGIQASRLFQDFQSPSNTGV